jgi:probable HAF family extracellular repeat protein
VNSLEEVVGYAQDQNLASRAFKYVAGGGGTMIDLNTVLPPNSPWVLAKAQSISSDAFHLAHLLSWRQRGETEK